MNGRRVTLVEKERAAKVLKIEQKKKIKGSYM